MRSVARYLCTGAKPGKELWESTAGTNSKGLPDENRPDINSRAINALARDRDYRSFQESITWSLSKLYYRLG